MSCYRKTDITFSRLLFTYIDGKTISIKNVFLAQQQHISTQFYFKDFPADVLKVKIVYKTCGKEFTEEYDINLNYLDTLITFRSETKINGQYSIEGELKKLRKSIDQLTDRFI